MAQHKAETQVDLRGEMLRDVSIWQRRIDFELGLMAEIIFTESTAEERTRMPAQWHEQPVQLFKWAVGEAKSRDQLRRRRWACIVGEVSYCSELAAPWRFATVTITPSICIVFL